MLPCLLALPAALARAAIATGDGASAAPTGLTSSTCMPALHKATDGGSSVGAPGDGDGVASDMRQRLWREHQPQGAAAWRWRRRQSREGWHGVGCRTIDGTCIDNCASYIPRLKKNIRFSFSVPKNTHMLSPGAWKYCGRSPHCSAPKAPTYREIHALFGAAGVDTLRNIEITTGAGGADRRKNSTLPSSRPEICSYTYCHVQIIGAESRL